MTAPTPDVIDLLVGITPGDPLDTIRAHRTEARTHAQQSYLALFDPTDPVADDFPLTTRHAVAVYVAGLHRQPDVARFYALGFAQAGGAEAQAKALLQAVEASLTEGPYGNYPAGPLSGEDVPGLHYQVDAALRDVLGTKLAAALEHAHLLVFHPRDASQAALQALLDAGWSTTDVVTLSQLVAFLSFQIRVVVGLRTLSAAGARA